MAFALLFVVGARTSVTKGGTQHATSAPIFLMRRINKFVMRRITKASLFVRYEWHLTPSGWVPVDWTPNGICTEPKTPPPVDRMKRGSPQRPHTTGGSLKHKRNGRQYGLLRSTVKPSGRSYGHGIISPRSESENPKVPYYDYSLT
jgi:hypothetical protein